MELRKFAMKIGSLNMQKMSRHLFLILKKKFHPLDYRKKFLLSFNEGFLFPPFKVHDFSFFVPRKKVFSKNFHKQISFLFYLPSNRTFFHRIFKYLINFFSFALPSFKTFLMAEFFSIFILKQKHFF